MYLDATGTARWIPLQWTSLAPVDVFVEIAAGRCAFRLTDLLALRALLGDLRSRHEHGSVNEITPHMSQKICPGTKNGSDR